MSSFIVKDSGKRHKFVSGMVRDTQEGKIDYTYVISGPLLDRWAQHLERGAQKYDRDNWMKADGEEELQRFKVSALRHLIDWLRGKTDEDHAAATVFNINGALYVEEKINGKIQQNAKKAHKDRKAKGRVAKRKASKRYVTKA